MEQSGAGYKCAFATDVTDCLGCSAITQRGGVRSLRRWQDEAQAAAGRGAGGESRPEPAEVGQAFTAGRQAAYGGQGD